MFAGQHTPEINRFPVSFPARLVAVRPAEPATGGLAPWQRIAIERHIRNNIDGDLNVSDLAAVARLSKSYFAKAFRKSLGCTPHDYIVRLRIAAAQQLMIDTSEKLCQIALACGFCDQPHLSRTFRDLVGQTPKDWRRTQMAA